MAGAASWAILGGASLSGLEWSIYDRWLASHAPVAVSPSLLVVERDAASEARFGTGSWDRAVLARLITNVARAGAVAVGLDVPLGQPSPPSRGGAASDAMLSQAAAQAGAVVYPVSPEPAPPLPRPVESAPSIGHTYAAADDDGVVRRVSLFVRLADRAVPAYGLALALASRQAPPTLLYSDERARLLVNYGAAGHRGGLRTVSFLEAWKAVDEGDAERLQRLVDGKVVLVLAEPTRLTRRTPVGTMSDMGIQAHLLNTILTASWPRALPTTWTVLGTLALAGLAAWLLLTLRWWAGLGGAVALAAGYGVSVVLALTLGGFVLPVWLPLSALGVACGVALLWIQLASSHRIRDLDAELARLRRALVSQESTVETLEEDLEAARAAAVRSAGAEEELGRATDALRAQLAEARTQETQTRHRLQVLERELRGMRAVDVPPGPLADAALDRLRRECEPMGIVTRDPRVLAVFGDLKKAARSSLPILLVGEPGTGKELFARAAHRLSPRADQPFVAVNMAAISPELFESELFGHIKGSFTGSVGDRKGYFELADRGTIFLDEIGDLRLEHQSKLLRVLQEKSFYRVGASRPTTVDVRAVAASNRDLERGVAEGWFREDLYFRLKGIVLGLPPLRERPEDLRLLATRFAREAVAEVGRDGSLALSEEALGALQVHDWSGNIRELQHCVRQAVALAEGPVITREDLRLPPPARNAAPGPTSEVSESGSDASVLSRLRAHEFDMQATAQALGWDRSTVTQRLKGLGFRALVEASGDRAKAALALAGDPSLARTVELKLREYHEHLLRAVQRFDSPEAALRDCRRRFKNLPERHFRSLEVLVRRHFEHSQHDGQRLAP